MPYRLGVDLGTTFTAAAVGDGGEPTVIGLGNRALQIPSVLFLKPDGEFLVGEAAERRGLSEPDRLAREFKRRIGDHVPIMVAGAPFSPQALTAQLLRWVVNAATERMGEPPEEVILTHPANWGPFRLELLDQVAVMAGLTQTRRCTEPEAAAAQYAAQTRINAGDKVAVYDLGGGTFDACVLEKTSSGFRALGTPEGVEHLGGVDFDEAVLRHVLSTLNTTTPLDPDDPEVTIGLARLRRDCVEAKEALSTDVDTLVSVALPGLATTVRITRAEFETMIRPALTETIAATTRALRSAHLDPTQLRSILLVGGSSRIPLVSEMLHQEFAVPTALDTHPKHDIALGSIRTSHESGITLTVAGAAADQPPPETPEVALVDLSWRLQDEQSTVPAPAAEVSPPGSPPPAAPPPAGPRTADADLSPPSQPVDDGARPAGGMVRVLAVVLAAVLLGAGVGVVIALRDRQTVAGPPTTSAPPSSPSLSSAVATPTPSPSPTPSPTPDPFSSLPVSAPLNNQIIVWPRIRDGDWDVATLDLRTGEEISLTEGPVTDRRPVISRNRRTIMYTRVTEVNQQEKHTLRVMAANGDGDRLLFDPTSNGCDRHSRPAVLPDGHLVITCSTVAQPRTRRLLVMTLEGQVVRQLDEANIGDPTVTPDGRSVLYWRNDEGREDGGALYRAAIDGATDPVQLTEGGDGVDADPAVSRKGRQLAFSRGTDSGRVIMTAPFNGKDLTSTPKPVTSGENDQYPSWSPDEKRIVYKSGPGEDGDLYVLDLDSGESERVVDDPEHDTQPAWTPR